MTSCTSRLPAPPFLLSVGSSSNSTQPPPCISLSASVTSAGVQQHAAAAAAVTTAATTAAAAPPLLAARAGGNAPAPPFVHPGVFIGTKQLAYARAQAKIGGTPFNVTLAKAISNTYVNTRNASSMSLDWNGTISCGFFDRPDYGCRNESSDSVAVEVNAMLWAVTGDETWAVRAISILNFYGRQLRGYADWGNGKLEAAWSADKFARAAELLATTGAPWAPADADAFRKMLQDASVPMLYNGSCYNGNWELAMIEALSSIAVFTNNATLFAHAIDMWRERVPAYFYLEEEDGLWQNHKTPPHRH